MRNVVFIRPTKVAGTSIEKSLDLIAFRSTAAIKNRFKKQEGMVNFGHMDYALLVEKGLIKKEFDETAFKFAFVRNPYDRVVSAYHDMRVRGRYGRAVSRIRARTMGFKGFCKEVINSSVDDIGTHHVYHDSIYNPQVRWIENVELDFLGRYENLYEDFKKLVEDLGLEPRELTWMRRSRNSVNRKPFMEFYCDETKAIVEKVYEEGDFAGLGIGT